MVFHTPGRVACLLAMRTLPPYNNSKLVDFVEAAVLFRVALLADGANL